LTYPNEIQYAVYRDQEVPLNRGNPFIEALPCPLSRAEVDGRLTRRVPRDPTDINRPPEVRYQLISQIPHFMQPLARHVDLYARVCSMIAVGYRPRNPVLPSCDRKILDIKQQIVDLDRLGAPIEAVSAPMTALIGGSGVGKSYGLKAVFSLFPQVIQHVEYKGRALTKRQIIWLWAECPEGGSPKALCYQIFFLMDRALGTNENDGYARRYGNKRNNLDRMIIDISILLADHGVGVLVIDEIQYLIDSKQGEGARLLNLLVSIANRLGIPVILIGTFQASEFLSRKFRLARRICSFGDIVWDRLNNNEELRYFIKALLKMNYLRTAVPMEGEEFEAIVEAIYQETFGIEI